MPSVMPFTYNKVGFYVVNINVSISGYSGSTGSRDGDAGVGDGSIIACIVNIFTTVFCII